MTKLRVLDLFSGIGGFSLGLERTGGFETVAFCEIEKFPRKVLRKHWPEVPIYEDIAMADFGPIGPVDLVTAGFPCQDISLAGQGAGLAGARSGLFWHILRAARMVGQPRLLLENVAALLGRGMGSVLGALAQVGYDAEWHCIPASAVGAPHRRDRLWILADPDIGETRKRYKPAEERGRPQETEQAWLGSGGKHTDPHGSRQLQPEGRFAYFGRWLGDLGEEMADAMRLNEQGKQSKQLDAQERGGSIKRPPRSCGDGGRWWSVEPNVGRVAHGIPDRAHRLAALGNAVVPQVVQVIGAAILEAENGHAILESEGRV